MPNQVAVVCTLLTTAARGHASKGRMYLPALGVPLAGAGVFGLDKCAEIANVVKTLITTINTIGTVAVFSKLDADPGVSHEVTSVRVGNKFDTHRSRAKKVQEQFAAATI